MTFYYSKDDTASVADMKCYNYKSANSRIVFDELIAKKGEGCIYLFVSAQEFTNCKNSKDPSWKFSTDTKTRIKVNTAPYEDTDFKTKVKTIVQPTKIELAIANLLEKNDYEDHLFKGSIQFTENPALECIVTGKDANGIAMPEVVAKSFEGLVWNVTKHPIEQKIHFKDEDLTLPKARGGFSKSGQTHFEKLNDKFQWLKQQVLAKYPALNVETFFDITEQGIYEQPISDDLKAIVVTVVHELKDFVR